MFNWNMNHAEKNHFKMNNVVKNHMQLKKLCEGNHM